MTNNYLNSNDGKNELILILFPIDISKKEEKKSVFKIFKAVNFNFNSANVSMKNCRLFIIWTSKFQVMRSWSTKRFFSTTSIMPKPFGKILLRKLKSLFYASYEILNSRNSLIMVEFILIITYFFAIYCTISLFFFNPYLIFS